MNISDTIKSIVLEIHDNELSEEETQAVMDRILGLGSWEDVRNGLLAILYENDTTLWNEAILFVYYFLNRGYAFEEVKTIALLYNCLSLSESMDPNLVWTITKTIKTVPYLSEYDPYRDPPVLDEMDRIDRARAMQIG